MNLTPTELERLTICAAAELARKHRAKELLPTRGTRKLNKQHMMHNSACPEITVPKALKPKQRSCPRSCP